MIHFSWDEEKNRKNLRDHGIAFPAARPVFFDPYRITDEDSVVEGEQRWRTIGIAGDAAILLVVHLEMDFEGDLYVRMISARGATPVERYEYEQNRLHDIGRSDQH
jgi:uncharacterized DUF497 family protein